MRPVTVNPFNVQQSLREIERASREGDTTEMAQNFSFTGTVNDTFTLNLTAPTLANTAAVLATLLQLMQKGGLNRTT